MQCPEILNKKILTAKIRIWSELITDSLISLMNGFYSTNIFLSIYFHVRLYARSYSHNINQIQWLISLCSLLGKSSVFYLRTVWYNMTYAIRGICTKNFPTCGSQFPRGSWSIHGSLGYDDNFVVFFLNKAIHKLNNFLFKEFVLIAFARIWKDCAEIHRKC